MNALLHEWNPWKFQIFNSPDEVRNEDYQHYYWTKAELGSQIIRLVSTNKK